jgi:hypothetical protein
MHLKAGWKIGLDFVEKPQELLMPMPPVARLARPTESSGRQRTMSGPLPLWRL